MQHTVAFAPGSSAAATFQNEQYKSTILREEVAAALQAYYAQAGAAAAEGATMQLAADNPDFPNAAFRVTKSQPTAEGIHYEIELP